MTAQGIPFNGYNTGVACIEVDFTRKQPAAAVLYVE